MGGEGELGAGADICYMFHPKYGCNMFQKVNFAFNRPVGPGTQKVPQLFPIPAGLAVEGVNAVWLSTDVIQCLECHVHDLHSPSRYRSPWKHNFYIEAAVPAWKESCVTLVRSCCPPTRTLVTSVLHMLDLICWWPHRSPSQRPQRLWFWVALVLDRWA